ncbi:MAG: hypothetical protein GX916_01345 [Clostridiales bacterium]|nr:hypothetical protein [Clostridiales bacterium]
MKNRYSLLLLVVLMAFCTACSTYANAPAWLSVGGKNEKVLAVSTDGARFLLGAVQPSQTLPERELKLRVLDKASGASCALYFAEDPYLELLAHGVFLRTVQDEAKRAALIEKNGGAASVVMRAGWRTWPQLMGTGGDYMLLYSAAMPGYARVDTRTGETLYIDASAACMGPDGSVLYRSRDTSATWLLKPETIQGEAFPLEPAKGSMIAPFSMCLLSDGSVWLIEHVVRAEQPQVEGEKALVRDAFFVHYGADGQELGRVGAGGFNMGTGIPQMLFFSEQTGVGVTYSPQYAMNSVMWTFAEGDDTAQALLIENLMPPAMCCAERDAVVDELGKLIAEAPNILPLGVSADGARLLVYHMDSAYLLALDLQTLKADILMTDEQLTVLYDEKNVPQLSRHLGHIREINWNGGDLLCGPSGPDGCALRIPYTEMFNK